MTSPAATKISRKTEIRQVLDIHVDLGPIAPASHLEKLRVTRKCDGVEMFVNAKDFGVHEKDKETGKTTKRYPFTPTHFTIIDDYDPDLANEYVEPDKVISLYTKDDLATMKIAELREVPEYARIPIADRRRLSTKQDYVDAILGQRQPSVVAEPEDSAVAEPEKSKKRKPQRQREAIGD